jgi:hypothetical protein
MRSKWIPRFYRFIEDKGNFQRMHIIDSEVDINFTIRGSRKHYRIDISVYQFGKLLKYFNVPIENVKRKARQLVNHCSMSLVWLITNNINPRTNNVYKYSGRLEDSIVDRVKQFI